MSRQIILLRTVQEILCSGVTILHVRHVSLETSLVQVPVVLILKKKQKMISITITPF